MSIAQKREIWYALREQRIKNGEIELKKGNKNYTKIKKNER